MAIRFENKDIVSVFKENKTVQAIYKGARLVWEAIRSCFGKGYYINAYPWDNEDAWKNNS